MSTESLRLAHMLGERISVTAERAGGELFSYVYRPEVAWEAPKPYLHPIRTLAGHVVTGYRPNDHRWHKGVQMTASRLSGQNLWGGHTYLRGEGYRRLPELVGSMSHLGFGMLGASAYDRAVIEQNLAWRPHHGAHWADERRRIEVRDVDHCTGSWALTWSSRVTNRRDEPLRFGSPATEGLEGSGYTGLFWRGPRAFRGGRILGPRGEGPELMGSRSPWLAFVGEYDDVDGYATVIFQHAVAATRWFVRNEPYAAIAASFAFSEELELAPGQSLDLRYRMIVADGAWDRRKIDEHLEECLW